MDGDGNIKLDSIQSTLLLLGTNDMLFSPPSSLHSRQLKSSSLLFWSPQKSHFSATNKFEKERGQTLKNTEAKVARQSKGRYAATLRTENAAKESGRSPWTRLMWPSPRPPASRLRDPSHRRGTRKDPDFCLLGEGYQRSPLRSEPSRPSLSLTSPPLRSHAPFPPYARPSLSLSLCACALPGTAGGGAPPAAPGSPTSLGPARAAPGSRGRGGRAFLARRIGASPPRPTPR